MVEVGLKQKHLIINKLSVICGIFFAFFLLMFLLYLIKNYNEKDYHIIYNDTIYSVIFSNSNYRR